MATRKTSKAGIPKLRVQDSALQRQLDAIVERLEVLDGVRGDDLDQAVTFRDLNAAGYPITTGLGGGGSPQIGNRPDTGDGPGVGPTTAPENLAATETFLALLLTWTNPSFNLQHIEVWRSATDNLSAALMVGTTVSPQFVDYVGAEAAYYYWVRALATDGTYSAYNAVAGTLGETGINPGNLSIDPRFFALVDGTGTELPFLTDGAGTIGIDGDLIVSESIRATSIVGNSIGADQIAAIQLSAINSDMGTITAGLLRTADSPAYRVEVQDQAATFYPLWYGSGAKSSGTGLFYVDQNGQVVVKGLLDAGMIRQSFFAPATTNYNSFRIACDYPSNYSGGVYSGKAAHICPILSTSQATAFVLATRSNSASLSTVTFTSPTVSVLGPANSSATQYGRLGSDSELLHITVLVTATSEGTATISGWNQAIRGTLEVDVQYQYDGDTQWSYLTTLPMTAFGTGTVSFSTVVCTRSTAFDTLYFRYRVRPLTLDLPRGEDEFDTILSSVASLISSSLVITAANFGYADNTLTTLTASQIDDTPLTPEQLDQLTGVPQLPGFNGGIIP